MAVAPPQLGVLGRFLYRGREPPRSERSRPHAAMVDRPAVFLGWMHHHDLRRLGAQDHFRLPGGLHHPGARSLR